MKISIWQQFSSNHSGSYFIVGVFPSAGAARHAEDELKAMLRTIDDWHRENPHFFRNWDRSLPPPEREAAEKYKVEWPHPIDWEGWAEYGFYLEHPTLGIDPAVVAADDIQRAVSSTHNVAFAGNPGQTWMGMQPFKGLLEHFGAETVGYEIDDLDGYPEAVFRVTCIPPDKATAEKLKQLPPSLDLVNLTVEGHENHLAYKFQFLTPEDLADLSAILEANDCTNIQVSLFEKGG